MNLDEMKRQWSEIKPDMDKVKNSINQQKIDNMKTSQQQLVDQYRTFGSVAALFTLLSYFICTRFFDNVWILLGTELFFAMSATMDFYLFRKLGEIDLTTMPVTEVAQKAAACRRMHHIFQLILIPSAVVLLAYMAYVMTNNTAAIYGMCIGAVIGLVFGLKAYFKIMNDYKNLIQN